MIRTQVLFFLLLVTVHALSGQNLRGVVFHSETKIPLEGVEISIQNRRILGFTGEDGAFSASLSSGRYTLVLKKQGFVPYEVEVPITPDPLYLSVGLDPLTYNLHQGITITAQRSEQDPLVSPVHFSILTQTQLREEQARSTPEALMGMTGVWMQKTNHGGGSPFVRGLTGNQTLLLVDGIRLNNSTYRYGPNQYLNTVDPMILSRVEVLRGSGAVAYGSDALGGTVNLLSQNPEYSPSGFRLKGEGHGKYMSDEMEKSVRAQVELTSPRTAFRVGAGYKDFGDVVAGGRLGVLSPSGYTETNLDFKGRQLVGDAGEITLALQHTEQEHVGRYDQVAQRGYAEWEFDPQIRTLAYLRYEQETGSRLAARVRTTASFQRSFEGRFSRREGSSVQNLASDEIRTGGLQLEIESELGENWTSVSGFDFYYDLVYSEAETRDTLSGDVAYQRGIYPDGATAWQAALFTLHTWEYQRWLLNVGARYQQVGLMAEDNEFGDLDLMVGQLVGNLGMSYEMFSGQRITAGVNTGFRAPNLNDLSSFGPFDSGIEVPTSGLRPEKSLTAELGYKIRKPHVAFSIVAFQSWLFDLMVRQRATYQGDSLYDGQLVYQKVNEEGARIRGVEGDLEVRRGPVRAYAGVSYTFGETIEEEASPLRRIPPLNGRLGLRYQQGNYYIKLEGLAAATQDRLSSGDMDDHRIPAGGTPGWAIMNARVGYQADWFTIRLGVNNMFDEGYRYHGSGVDEYGRSFWVALDLTLAR